MIPSKSSPPYPSFESLRRQAKKLALEFAAGDPAALARIHAQLPVPELPLSLWDAQLVLAREYGFAGWQDLRSAVLRQEGKGLEWAAAEAERVIHDNNIEGLRHLLQEYPALLSWRSDSGESILGFATGSYGNSGDPFREQMFTRVECAEFLLNEGATIDPGIWEGAIQATATGVLQVLSRKGVLPRNLQILAALGDYDGVRDCLPGADAVAVTQALFAACRFRHRDVAAQLLDRCIELDHALGERVDKWRGRSGLLDYLLEHPAGSGNPWVAMVTSELESAMHKGDLDEYNRWLEREPDLLSESNLGRLVRLLEIAVYNNREPFVARLLQFAPAFKAKRPPSAALTHALDYGNAHLLPLLTPIWPMPDDLPHAAGIGDLARVKSWFDEAGNPKLGSLARHHPTNNPSLLRDLHWIPANAQHVLDTALAWACMNRQFAVASFLLDHGANINTDWSTHEPSSILHQCAWLGKYEAAQFLIDHGIDLTIRDYRFNATARGWAEWYQDKRMAELLAQAEHSRKASS